ncbi:hypothetical protein [Limnobacter sp.]|uniref:hypothetical protein n=1 Tax=Limnobacter sp. TaxID=2003368 RepID=UPI00351836A1
MSEHFDGGPPLLTEVIESGLQEIENSTGERNSDPRLEILRAQLPELLEMALLRVKPQLMAELEKLIVETLRKN